MAPIRIVRREELDFKATTPVGDQTRAYYFPGSESELQLFEVRCDPGHVVESHAHSLDEIILVVDGELVAGSQRVGPGGALYIAADTLYSFRAGDEGLTFLNYRAVAGARYIPKDQFLEERAARSG